MSRPCALCPLLTHILLHHVDLPGQRLGQQRWNSIPLIYHHPPNALWTCPTIRSQCRRHHSPPRNQQSSVLGILEFVSKRLQRLPSVLRLHPRYPRVVFPLFFWFFCFRTIVLGHSELPEKDSLRPEWGQDRKAPSFFFSEGYSVLTQEGRAYWRINVLSRLPSVSRIALPRFEPLILLGFVRNFPQAQNTKYHMGPWNCKKCLW